MKTVLLPLLLLATLSQLAYAEGDDMTWNTSLKNQFFSGKSIEESDAVIELEAPYRAEDPAIVPIKVSSKFAQSKERYIKKIWLFVDKNPFPFVGEFEFFPESGKADLAMRIRVNTYSNIRAVAETNEGKYTMTKKFVKASGGCSAPIGADLDEAMSRLGKVKFRLDDGVHSGQASLAQLMISHPNLTGMQMDQMTRFVRKSHFIDQLKVSFNNKPVLNAKIDIASSADPNFRCYLSANERWQARSHQTPSCQSRQIRIKSRP